MKLLFWDRDGDVSRVRGWNPCLTNKTGQLILKFSNKQYYIQKRISIFEYWLVSQKLTCSCLVYCVLLCAWPPFDPTNYIRCWLEFSKDCLEDMEMQSFKLKFHKRISYTLFNKGPGGDSNLGRLSLKRNCPIDNITSLPFLKEIWIYILL